MTHWIPFVEGEYLVEQAFLSTSDGSATALENTIIEVYSDRQGNRHLKGHSRVRNLHMVELLEDSDDLDIMLDLGDEFKYLLRHPALQSGKVFSPDAKSTLWFTPNSPWQQIPQDEFDTLLSNLKLLSQ